MNRFQSLERARRAVVLRLRFAIVLCACLGMPLASVAEPQDSPPAKRGSAYDVRDSEHESQKANEPDLAANATPEEQLRAGLAYLHGMDAPRDAKRAARWFAKAAEAGDPAAQYHLAFCYLIGEGVVRDPAAGMHWLFRAAHNGHTEAQFALGLLYLNGTAGRQPVAEGEGQQLDYGLGFVLKPDLLRARSLLSEAAGSGHGLAIEYLEVVQARIEGREKSPEASARRSRKKEGK